MSLWFTLRMNDKAIGSLVIRRIDPPRPLAWPGDNDVIGTYVVTRDEVKMGTVEHRYGDGAWSLIRCALDLPVPARKVSP